MEGAGLWQTIQAKIWDCQRCASNLRVAIQIRQRTPAPVTAVSLLLVGLAPPYEDNVCGRKVANSATNDPRDNVRSFVEETLAQPWDELIAKGRFLIHAIKCAVVRNGHGSQDPPPPVVENCCNPVGFEPEFRFLHPPRVVALEDMARRAILKTRGVIGPPQVTLTRKLPLLEGLWPEGIPCKLGNAAFILHPTRFPRTVAMKLAAATALKRAAQLMIPA
jgi:uracil-DNA glycosylase